MEQYNTSLKIHKGSLWHPASGQDGEVLHVQQDFHQQSGRVLAEAPCVSCQFDPPPPSTSVIVNSDLNHVNKSMAINGVYVRYNGRRGLNVKKVAEWGKQTCICINTEGAV